MTKVFLSYRRGDSADVTGRIDDRLIAEFGRESVFKDVDSLPLGLDFRKHLSSAVGECNVLLAVIGDTWLTTKDERGIQRLEDETDFVRIEIESALHRDIPVVPLLLGTAEMPRADELPDAIRELAFRNGTKVRPDPDFHRDMDRILAAIRHLRPPASVPKSEQADFAARAEVPVPKGDREKMRAAEPAHVHREAAELGEGTSTQPSAPLDKRTDAKLSPLEVLAVLKRGVREWNAWKSEQSLGIELIWAELREADLRSADLRDVDFYGAKLCNADLKNADLSQANMFRVELTGAHLEGADLRVRDGLTPSQVSEAHCWDQATRWPTGFVPPDAARPCGRK